MSSNFWYLDRDHTQRGPVAEDEFVRLIRQGVDHAARRRCGPPA